MSARRAVWLAVRTKPKEILAWIVPPAVACAARFGSRRGDETEVNLGSLDAPDRLAPTYELWTDRRESWLPPFPLATRYARDRDTTRRSEE